MHVCILTPYNPAENPRVVKEAAALLGAGYRVTVVCGSYAGWSRQFAADALPHGAVDQPRAEESAAARKAAEKAEAERKAAEKAEAERHQAEMAELERKAAEQKAADAAQGNGSTQG